MFSLAEKGAAYLDQVIKPVSIGNYSQSLSKKKTRKDVINYRHETTSTFLQVCTSVSKVTSTDCFIRKYDCMSVRPI